MKTPVCLSDIRRISPTWLLRFQAAAVCLAVLTFTTSSKLLRAQQITAPRIVGKIQGSGQRVLQGTVPQLARAEYDRGAVEASAAVNHVQLLFKRTDQQESALKQLVSDLHNPTSSSFHKWLTPEQFGAQFGPAEADVTAVTSWLQAEGFQVNKTSKGKLAVDFSGTAGQVSSTFKTQLHTYVQNGVTFHSNSTEVQIPEALSSVVAGIVSLNDIKPRAYSTVLGTAKMTGNGHAASPEWNADNQCSDANGNAIACTFYVMAPSDLAVQYNLNPIYKAGTTGKGQTIGVISASNVDSAVVKNFRSAFGLSTTNLPQAVVDNDDPGQSSSAVEAYLDVEMAGAIAPDATVNLYVSNGSLVTSGLQDAAVRAVDDNVADVLTLSYGECEQQLGPAGNQFFYSLWAQAATQGQSVFVSSGDGGAAGCDNHATASAASLGIAVNGFSSTPFNTSVGGTDVYYNNHASGRYSSQMVAEYQADWGSTSTFSPAASLLAPIQEQAWNQAFGLNVVVPQNDIVAGGGGPSSCVQGTSVSTTTGATGVCTSGYAKPAWQTGTGVPQDGVRDQPDISLFASAGTNTSFFAICASVYDCVADLSYESLAVTGIGGTSASSPMMAGIMTLINQSQKGRQGNPNFYLYPLAAQYPNSFNDITIGNINVPCVKATPNCMVDANGVYSLQQYATTAGYDMATGLGTVNAANLLANWGKLKTVSTTTLLGVDKTTFAHGTAVTVRTGVSATSGIPTGSVAVLTTSEMAGQTAQGTIALTSGAGSESLSSLPGGTYNITGYYAGDGTYGASTSSATSVTVTPESSSTIVTGGALTLSNVQVTVTAGQILPYGDTVFLDAGVIGSSGAGLATGSATFYDNGTSIGTYNLGVNGSAEINTGLLGVGTHAITASYSGDNSFTKSTSAPLTFSVVKANPAVRSTDNPYVATHPGDTYTVNAGIYGGYQSAAPTGSVTVTFGTLPAQTVALTPFFRGVPGGSANITFTPTVAGAYPVVITYSGDANFTAGTPKKYTVTVKAATKAASTVTLTSDITTLGPDSYIKLAGQVTGSVTGVVPTGNWEIDFNGLGVYYKLDATGVFSTRLAGVDFPTGTSQIIARYDGDKNYEASVSAPITIVNNEGDYSLTASNPTMSITSGGTGTSNLTVTSIPFDVYDGGMSGAVNFTCTPSSAAITCSFNPASVTLPAYTKQVNTTLTIGTNIPTAKLAPPTRGGWLIRGGGVAAALLVFFFPGTRRRYGRLCVLFLLCGVLGPIGCSNKGTTTTTTPAPTSTGTNAAPGTYTVLVTSTGSGIIHQMTLKVFVK